MLTASRRRRNIMNLAIIVLTAFLAVAFLGSGAVKLAGAKRSLQIRDQLGVSAALWRVIGALEIAGAAGLAIGLVLPMLGVAAAAGLSLLMVGAIAAHARARDLSHSAPAAVLLAVAIATVVVRLLTA
jgi:uncharacterized membrane protein YphA (DoxX/SURF4 family)